MDVNLQIQELPIELLERGQFQPRRLFEPTALQELAASMRAQGLIQPLIVRKIANRRYEIIAGERRWRAAQLAGFTSVPCWVRELTDKQAAAVTIIENIQRAELTPIEEAQSYQRLIDEFGYSHDVIASQVGISRVAVTNVLRLLKLDSRVQQLINDKKLSSGHGKVLAALPMVQQYTLAEQCVNKAWSVRTLEQAIKKALISPSFTDEEQVDVEHLERKISEQVGSPVKLEREDQKQSGWLKIRYFDHATLAGLLEKMGVKANEE
jgi:ParB family transcriptional regulator, chromosome partitioning protein